MTDDSNWDRLTLLFDRLLESPDPEGLLALEPDLKVREAAANLWRNHILATREDYLGAPVHFDLPNVFQPGQILMNRFRIDAMLGSGGMGEVYLAWDQRMEGPVALKTIVSLLAKSPSICRRFVSEVQTARQVTHPNVCRIHELFDEGKTVFFSMEYVDGVLLSAWMEEKSTAGQARLILKQLAQGLHAAHQTNVVHGDLKPSNVMVKAEANHTPRAVIMDFGLARVLNRGLMRAEEDSSLHAGTAEYMAPELKDGRPPDVRSDIFAFGKIAKELFPTERYWDECIRADPTDRPPSLERIVRRMETGISRRYWIGAAAIVTAGTASYLVSSRAPIEIHLPSNTRILVNRFRSQAGQVSTTRLLRSTLLTALLQTSRIHAISDEDFLPLLTRFKLAEDQPLGGTSLDQVLALLRAPYWIDGSLRKAGGRYSLDVALVSAIGRQVLVASSFHDAPNVFALAQAAATWLRKTAGESSASLTTNTSDVPSYTSSVPEALQKYFDGMEHYAAADMDQAIPLFEEAIRLDPMFAQAHAMLGLILYSSLRYDDAFREIQTAFKLADKLPDHERASIEASYYKFTGDPTKMVETSMRIVANRSDEPRFHSSLGQALEKSGRLEEAVAAFRRAVDLSPNDWMHVQRLEAGLVDAGLFQEALNEFRIAVQRGVSNKWIYNGVGSAYIGLERYDDAIRSFSAEPNNPERTADVQMARILKGEFDIAIAAMEEQRASARTSVAAFQANEFLCSLYYVTDHPALATNCVREMARLPRYPAMTERFAATASWARRLGDDETLSNLSASAEEMQRMWPNARTQALSLHVTGLQAWLLRNALEVPERLMLLSSGTAFSIWAIFDLAEYFTSRAQWALADEYWRKFESHRGTVIVNGWSPVILVLGWMYRATAAQGKADREGAYLSSRKVLEHWAPSNSRLAVVQTAERINFASKPL